MNKQKSPIIIPTDERWPLLEMVSQSCGLPLSHAEEQAVVEMDQLLELLDEEAAGLAAVQIGVPRRIFLLRNGVDSEGKAFNKVYINPTIVARSKAVTKKGEGCLSIPGMGALVERPKSVTLEYFDLDGEVHTETFTGFWAKAVMHEMDHLNGILIVQHLESQMTKQPRCNSFGMKITPQRQKAIARRRAQTKRARRVKKHAKATGR